MLQNNLTHRLRLRAPIVSAGMAFVAGPRLAAAVSNAGGLGMLGGSLAPPEQLRRWIRETRALTPRPFGVSLVVAAATDDHVAVCTAERVSVVCFQGGLRIAPWVDRLRAAGCEAWAQVGRVEEAFDALEARVTAIVAQGTEAGGHNRSCASTMVLVPALAEAVAPVPVVAAGGIATGRGLAAALVLGAQAVWCGTRFVACAEADAHEDYKTRILGSGVHDTVRVGCFGPEWPSAQVRVLRNRAVRAWLEQGPVRDDLTQDPTLIGRTTFAERPVAMPKYSAYVPTTATTGDLEEMCLPAGQSAGLVGQVLPADEIVASMMADARAALAGVVTESRPATCPLS